MNDDAAKRIGWIIAAMHAEASKRHAPVFEAEEKTEGDPFKILVFTMLSARTKDATTSMAVGRLFARAGTPGEMANLEKKELERLLHGVGFFRVKAGNLRKICAEIAASGRVPDTLDGLLALPGIGRKTANIVLSRAFGEDSLGVDVHVHRISNRLGLVRTKTPEETERALMRIVPRKHLRGLNRDFVAFGQTLCTPRKPQCGLCPLNRLCFRKGVPERCEGCRFGKR